MDCPLWAPAVPIGRVGAGVVLSGVGPLVGARVLLTVSPILTVKIHYESPQSSIAWYAEVQKSRQTSGGLGDVQARWVIRMMTMSSLGSEYQEVPRPPSQPYRPGTAAMSSRLVTTETPNPQPWLSKKPEISPDTAFCSGVSWSVVMVSTESLDRTRSPPCLPWESIIWPKAR